MRRSTSTPLENLSSREALGAHHLLERDGWGRGLALKQTEATTEQHQRGTLHLTLMAGEMPRSKTQRNLSTAFISLLLSFSLPCQGKLNAHSRRLNKLEEIVSTREWSFPLCG